MRLGGWLSAVKRCECYEVWERDFHRRDGSVVSEGWFSTVETCVMRLVNVPPPAMRRKFD